MDIQLVVDVVLAEDERESNRLRKRENGANRREKERETDRGSAHVCIYSW